MSPQVTQASDDTNRTFDSGSGEKSTRTRLRGVALRLGGDKVGYFARSSPRSSQPHPRGFYDSGG